MFVFKQGKDKQKQISDLENYLSTVTVKMSECSGYEFRNVKVKEYFLSCDRTLILVIVFPSCFDFC